MNRSWYLGFAFLLALSNNSFSQPYNFLTPAEDSAGFVLMFDGNQIDDDLIAHHPGWRVNDNALNATNGGDMCFTDIYKDFELRMDVRVGNANQNSGVFTRSPRRGNGVWADGAPEFALQGEPHNCNYPCHTVDDYAQKYASSYPQITGQPYNPMVLFFNGAFVEFWVQGEKVNEFELWSDAWLEDKANSSRWANSSSYGSESEGYICFQDHGGNLTTSTWFRNLKIRSFEADGQVPTPVITLSDTTNESVTVELEVGMVGAEIRYTTDGSNPSVNSDLYTDAFDLDVNTELRVAAFRPRFSRSEIVTAEVEVIVNVLKAPSFSKLVDVKGMGFVIAEPHSFELRDVNGQLVISKSNQDAYEYQFQGKVKQGIYFLTVNTAGGTINEKVLLK